MRKPRITGDPQGANCYHVMSRTTGGQMLFGEREKKVFAKQLRRHAAFAGIDVLTWCMMDNHFHLLIRTPPRDQLLDELLSNHRRKFWRHLLLLYSREQVDALKREVRDLEREGNASGADRIIRQFTRRIGDLSVFVQALKFAFTVWYNQEHGRRGTLWMERFRSVLLEGEPFVLTKVAAYIDLNPVRAGMVEDPGHYRWSGYGAAVAGDPLARRGLSAVWGYRRSAWSRMAGDYRSLLCLEGRAQRDPERRPVARIGSGGAAGAGMKPPEEGASAAPLARPVRSFSRGVALGGREFVESLFARHREQFGPRRKTGARKMRGPGWKDSGLYALRDTGA